MQKSTSGPRSAAGHSNAYLFSHRPWKLHLSSCLDELGHHEEALQLKQEVYHTMKELAPNSINFVGAGLSVVIVLKNLQRHAEIKSFLSEHLPLARRIAGPDHDLTLRLELDVVEETLQKVEGGGKVGAKDFREAMDIAEDVYRRRLRIYGAMHPNTVMVRNTLDGLRSHPASLIVDEK